MPGFSEERSGTCVVVSEINRSSIEDSIIGPGARIAYKRLKNSLIGDNADVIGTPTQLNIGDNSGYFE